MELLTLLPRLWGVLSSRIGLAAVGLLLALGLVRSCQALRTAQSQTLMVAEAFRHPRVEKRDKTLTHRFEASHTVIRGSGTVRDLPGGGKEITFSGVLTADTTAQSTNTTDSVSISTPILPPSVAFHAPGRLVWAGWSIPERTPILGVSGRLLGPLWLGGWVRPSTTWDYGPTLMVTF